MASPNSTEISTAAGQPETSTSNQKEASLSSTPNQSTTAPRQAPHQQPGGVSGGETPGLPLRRLPGSKEGVTGYYNDLENWEHFGSLNRVRNYTIDKIAQQYNHQREFLADIYVLRIAENHVPLLVFQLTRTGNLTVKNLDGSTTVFTARHFFGCEIDRTHVFKSNGGKVGEVNLHEIYNEKGEKAYRIFHCTKFEFNMSFVCRSVEEPDSRGNNISSLPALKRVLVQLGQAKIQHPARALIIVAAFRLYHRFECQFTAPTTIPVYGYNINGLVFDAVCKIPVLPEIELPSSTYMPPTIIDQDASALVHLTEASFEKVATNQKMFKEFFFVKDTQKEKIILLVERSSLQTIPDVRFKNINSEATLFLYQQLTISSESAVYLGDTKLGNIDTRSHIKREYIYEETLFPEEVVNENATVTFRRGFEYSSASVVLAFNKKNQNVVINFYGYWDIYWKALIFSFVCKIFHKYIKLVRDLTPGCSPQFLREAAEKYNSRC